MPALTGVIETSLYVDDLDRASCFYEALFDLARIEGDDRFRAYSVGDRSVLLLFKRGASNHVTQLPGGSIGAHDGNGPLHFAFAIRQEDFAEWESKLTAHQITVEHRVKWPRGGTSLYVRDPDNNSVELATPGVWSIY
jgi:catechol 2,3-dioxygenase-like lactoylglutathione lyase family enzyme